MSSEQKSKKVNPGSTETPTHFPNINNNSPDLNKSDISPKQDPFESYTESSHQSQIVDDNESIQAKSMEFQRPNPLEMETIRHVNESTINVDSKNYQDDSDKQIQTQNEDIDSFGKPQDKKKPLKTVEPLVAMANIQTSYVKDNQNLEPISEQSSQKMDSPQVPYKKKMGGMDALEIILEDQGNFYKQDSDSDGEKEQFYQALKKSKWVMVYDYLKFAGCFIFMCDLMLKIAYYQHTKFITEQLHDLYFLFLIARPLIIFGYMLIRFIMQLQLFFIYRKAQRVADAEDQAQAQQEVRVQQVENNGDLLEGGQPEPLDNDRQEKPAQNFQEGQSIDNKDENVIVVQSAEQKQEEASRFPNSKRIPPSIMEVVLQLIFQSLIMYAGFCRITSVKSRKAKLMNTAKAQEAFLHTIPLTLLIYYNTRVAGVTSKIDSVIMFVSFCNLLEMFIETYLYQYFLNKNIDLERKFKQTPKGRIRDLSIACFMSLIFLVVSVLIAIFAIQGDECADGLYKADEFECYSCKEAHGETCQLCRSADYCHKCEDGFYPNGRGCDQCSENFTESCVTCTFQGCQTCLAGYYANYKTSGCSLCETLEGCDLASGACGTNGCTKCLDGYFLDESSNTCKLCSNAMTGCTECSSKDTCTKCANSQLNLVNGQCTCSDKIKNASTDRKGACVCDSGYSMTNRGCETCGSIIDGCDNCSITQKDTGLKIYSSANILQGASQNYLSCSKCSRSMYKNSKNSKCLYCSDKYDGCTDCGSSGKECNECKATHILDESNSRLPCRSCDYYMNNCERCVTKTDCTACVDGTRSIFGSCIDISPW